MKNRDLDDLWASVTTCPIHDTSSMDFDCDHCKTEVAEGEALLDELNEEANNRAEGLHTSTGAVMPPHVVLQVRMEALIDGLFRDPRSRLRFEVETGRRILMQLTEAQKAAGAIQTPEQGLHVVKNGHARNIKKS